MIVNVEYTTRVEVQVDTDAGVVKRVVVMDEGVELAREHGRHVIEEQGAIPLDDASIRQTALEIAERADWPAWEVGW